MPATAKGVKSDTLTSLSARDQSLRTRETASVQRLEAGCSDSHMPAAAWRAPVAALCHEPRAGLPRQLGQVAALPREGRCAEQQLRVRRMIRWQRQAAHLQWPFVMEPELGCRDSSDR